MENNSEYNFMLSSVFLFYDQGEPPSCLWICHTRHTYLLSDNAGMRILLIRNVK